MNGNDEPEEHSSPDDVPTLSAWATEKAWLVDVDRDRAEERFDRLAGDRELEGQPRATTRREVSLILLGWAALAVSVLVPLAVSVLSWLQTREIRCSELFEYTFAQLLVTCGERDSGVLVLGWVLWALTVGGVIAAGALAIAAVVVSQIRLRDRFVIFEAYVLLVGVGAVVLFTSGVLTAGETMLGGFNAWIIYAAGGSLLLLIVIAAVHPLVWLGLRGDPPQEADGVANSRRASDRS